MPVHRSYASFAKAIEHDLITKQKSQVQAHDVIAREALQDAHELTSGKVKQRQLNREHNPYGRGSRTPKGKVRGRRNALPVNKQSGRLNQAKYLRRHDHNGVITYRVGFRPVEDYFKYVLSRRGTSKMRTRPVFDVIEKRFKARVLGLRNALGRRK